MRDFDVIVVGGGHAGAEAAWASANLGCQVGLMTLSASSIASMPCNPAVGGTAKGQLVREIDALGGLMGEAIDATGVQFKVLNRSRGPAVWAPRAQADKQRYARWIRVRLEAHPGIEVIEAHVARLVLDAAAVRGVELLDGRLVTARAVVVTTGTFLNGLVHVGDVRRAAGRADEPPSLLLGEQLRALGLRVGRLKTGTPPRLSKASIDFAAATSAGLFHVEQGDDPAVPLSFLTADPPRNSVSCWTLHTSRDSHALVRSAIDRSPLFNGSIQGIGPRYCPSFEDKVMRFPERDRHLLHLEPEGPDVDEIYVNGLSMSLPADVQEAIIHSLPGLDAATMLRPGYAVEYDFVQPTELDARLACRRFPGLFLAGQINGTSGYEEAAGQGLLAGANAALAATGRPPFLVGRAEGYLGVMVDDLVTQGCLEPYRLFTSRAEFRLHLRADNADLRLTPRGRAVGLVDDGRWMAFEQRSMRLEANRATLRTHRVAAPSGATVHADEALKSQQVTAVGLRTAGLPLQEGTAAGADLATLETEIKYAGYLRRQEAEIQRAQHAERRRIPEDFAYVGLPGLSRELAERLDQVRPATLGQASRIPGMTPAATVLLHAVLSRGRPGTDPLPSTP
jgi:tRNA uridine 5-carboxymethylaminomethyl modification enzyme